jgi:hypothetical protein
MGASESCRSRNIFKESAVIVIGQICNFHGRKITKQRFIAICGDAWRNFTSSIVSCHVLYAMSLIEILGGSIFAMSCHPVRDKILLPCCLHPRDVATVGLLDSGNPERIRSEELSLFNRLGWQWADFVI